MTLLPPHLDLPSAETAAFALIRGLKGHARSWPDLAALAQLVMTYYQEIATADAPTLYDITTASPLVVAARILDAISSPESELPETERNDWALLATVAFAMWVISSPPPPSGIAYPLMKFPGQSPLLLLRPAPPSWPTIIGPR